jgi:PAS domain-containing protein
MATDIELMRLRAEVARLDAELTHARRTLDTSQRLAGVGSWEWDLRSGEVFWSDEMYRLYGYEPRAIDVDRSTSTMLTQPEDRERRARWIESMHATPVARCRRR